MRVLPRQRGRTGGTLPAQRTESGAIDCHEPALQSQSAAHELPELVNRPYDGVDARGRGFDLEQLPPNRVLEMRKVRTFRRGLELRPALIAIFLELLEDARGPW